MQKVNDQVNAGTEHHGVPRVETKPSPELKAAPDRDVSPAEIEEFMRSLACEKFKVDPHSRFCETCGYLRSEHRAPKQEK